MTCTTYNFFLALRMCLDKFKVPQEFVPEEKDQEVKALLMRAFETAIDTKLPEPIFMKAQLWGAAVPLNVLSTPKGCVFDSRSRVGICGDWLLSPSMEVYVILWTSCSNFAGL